MDMEKDEAITICLDNSRWMESIDSPMFQDQLQALSLYCQHKFKNPNTTVGVVGLAGNLFRIFPTKSLERIINSLNDGVITIGGRLDLVGVAHSASFRLDLIKDRQKRIVFFAGGAVCDPLCDAERLGKEMKLLKEACDVISFGNPYKCKREFFDILVSSADNNGNCNVCHVPPESSVLEAISRSSIFIPHLRGGIPSAQSPLMQYYIKNNCNGSHVPLESSVLAEISRCTISIPKVGGETRPAQSSQLSRLPNNNKAIDIYLKPPSDGADPNTDCPYCQTVLLTLKEKGVPYKTHFIDLLNKPKRTQLYETLPFKKRYETLPLIKFNDGTWASNSDVIVGMIDNRYEGRYLASPPQYAYLGLKILPKLAAFLKTNDENDDSKHALLYELKELDKHLSEHGGPYVNGKEVTAVDLSLAPKLYHLENACSYYNKGDLLKDLPKVRTYTQNVYSLGSFMETAPCRDNVIKGWEQRLARK